MGQIEITMLPSEQWQEMNIVKFNYKYLDYPCVATIVYFLPLEQPNCVTDSKIVNETIVESLKNAFGDISVIKKSILFDKVKEDYRKVFDGGRPRVDFIIRMIPEIPYEQYSLYVGKEIKAYDYHFSIYLNYLGKLEEFNKQLLITSSFAIDHEKSIKWGADCIETL